MIYYRELNGVSPDPPRLFDVTMFEDGTHPVSPAISVSNNNSLYIYFQRDNDIVKKQKSYSYWSTENLGQGYRPNSTKHGEFGGVWTKQTDIPYEIESDQGYYKHKLSKGGNHKSDTLLVNKRFDYKFDEGFLTLEFRDFSINNHAVLFDSSLQSGLINGGSLNFNLLYHAHNFKPNLSNSAKLCDIKLLGKGQSHNLLSITLKDLSLTTGDSIGVIPYNLNVNTSTGKNRRLKISFSKYKPVVTNVVTNQDSLNSAKFLSKTDPETLQNLLPSKYYLAQNYPNPFNPECTIKFELPKSSKVILVIYDLNGKIVSKLVNENLPAGYHSVKFNGENLSTGIYLYELTAENFKAVKKMILVK